jgi:rhodanese-related sulfurtransferase
VEQRGYDESGLTEELGLAYTVLGFGGPDPLTDEIFHNTRALLRDHRQTGEGDLLLHCGSSIRVGAVWLTSRVLDEGVAWEQALEEAQRVGLRSPALEEAARLYVLGAGNQEFGKLKEEIRAKLPGVAGVSVERLAQALEQDPAPLLIDSRAAEEYAVSHLPGARRAQTVDEALTLLEGLEPGRDVVVYCSVGYRSGYLARDLAAKDVANVRNLEGSIFEWANTGHPVYRGTERVEVVHPYDKKWGRFLRRDLWAEPASAK